MGWPLKRVFPSIGLTPAEIAPEAEKSRIERSLAVVGQSLDMFRADELSLEQEISDREKAHREKIAELTEALHQIRVCIEGFTANDRILVAGAKPPAEAAVPLPDGRFVQVERLVPRQVRGSTEERAAADLIVEDGKVTKSKRAAS